VTSTAAHPTLTACRPPTLDFVMSTRRDLVRSTTPSRSRPRVQAADGERP